MVVLFFSTFAGIANVCRSSYTYCIAVLLTESLCAMHQERRLDWACARSATVPAVSPRL